MAKKRSLSRKSSASSKIPRKLRALIRRGDKAYAVFHHEEALDAYTQALTWEDPKALPDGELFRIVWRRAETFRSLGDNAAARRDNLRLETLAREAGNTGWMADAALRLARDRGDHTRAIRLAKRSIKLVRAEGDQGIRAKALTAIGHAYIISEDFRQSHQSLKEALAILQGLDDHRTHALCLTGLSLNRQTPPAEQERYGLRAVDYARRAGDRRAEADVLSWIAIAAPDASAKRRYGEMGLALVAELGIQDAAARLYNHMGLLYLHLGLYETAHEFAQRGVNLSRQGLGAHHLSAVLETYARVALALEDLPEAEGAFQESLQLAEGMGMKGFAAYNILGLGRLSYLKGNLEQACESTSRSISMFREVGEMAELAYSHASLAVMRLAQGDWPAALKLANQAVKEIQSIDDANADFPPQDVWWTYHLVLKSHPKNRKYLDTQDHSKGTLDTEADRALDRAFELAQSNVTEVTDTGLKRNYWNKVEINRSILLEMAKTVPDKVNAVLGDGDEKGDIGGQLERMLDIGVRMNELRDPDELVEFVMAQLVELSGAEDAALILETEEGERTCRAQRGFVSGADPVAAATPFMDECARTAHAVLHQDVADVDPAKPAKGLFDRLSVLAVPLGSHGHVAGYLYAANHALFGPFNQADVTLVSAFSNQVAAALDNATLNRDLEQRVTERTEALSSANAALQDRASELSLINGIQRALAAKLDLASIYDTVVEQLRSIFETQVIIIYSADLASRQMSTVSGFEKGHKVEPLVVPFNSLYDDLMKNQGTFVFNGTFREYAESFSDYTVPQGELPRSLVGIPIPRPSNPSTVDIIGLQDIDGEYFFTESDVRLLETLASSMSVALENARLLEETERRAAELSIINSVQQGLASKLDMQAIYDLVGNRIRDIFDAQVVHIRIYDPETDIVSFPFVLDRDERLEVPPIKVNGIGITGEIINTRQPLLVNRDLRGHSEALGGGLLEGQKEWPKSALGCPIMAGDKVTGIVLVENFDREDVFSQNDVNLLTTLASSMSVALENARLFDETNHLLEETRQRAAELAIINNVGQALVKKLEFDAILELVGQRLRDLFEADTAYIMLYDPETRWAHTAYYIDRGERISLQPGTLTTGLNVRIVDTREPLRLGTAEESDQLGAVRIASSDGEQDRNESFLGVPFFNGDKVAGVISVQSYQQHAYDEEDVRLLGTLASSMSVALENARLFEETNRLLDETRQRNAELAVINKVQEGLASKLDLSGIVEVVGEELAHILQTENVSIGLLVDDGHTVITPYLLEEGRRIPVDPLPLDQTTYWRQAIETRKPVLPDYETAKKKTEEWGGIGDPDLSYPKTNLFVPILSGDKGLGVISVFNKDRENAYDESDVNLVSTLANSMSVALENARLFEETNRLLDETRQRNAELAVINSIQDGLASKLDIEGIFDLVGDKIQEIFDAQVVVISIYDPATGIESWPYAIERGKRLQVEPGPTYGFSAHVFQTLEPLVINEAMEERSLEFGADVMAGEPVKSLIVVPLVVGGQAKGVISLQNIDHEHAFSDSDLRLLTTVASSMSVALENARLFEETTRLLEETRQRAEELSLINDVGTALSKKLQYEAILELVGERVRQIFQADTMYILLYDADTQLAEMAYYVDRGKRHEQDIDEGKPGPTSGLSKIIIDSSEPLLLGTREASDELGSVRIAKPGEEDLNQSFLGVPFFRGDHVGGVISVQSYQKHRYDESDIRLLMTLATSMSVSLENARLFEETTRLLEQSRQRNTELAAVNTVSQALVAETEIDNLIQLIGDQVRKTFHADIAYVALFDPKTDMVNFPYLFGDDLSPMRYGEGLTGQILQSGQPLLLNRDIDEAMAEMHAERVGVAAASYLGVPIVVGSKAIGVVSVQSTREEGRFGETDVSLLGTIAANAGAALRNAQLLAETERRAAEMASLNEIGREASASLDLSTVLDQITERAGNMLDANSSAVILLDDDQVTLRPIAASGVLAEALITGFAVRIGEGILGDVVKKGRAERISDTSTDSRAMHIEGTGPDQAGEKVMVAPLFARETVIGAMAVWRGPEDDAFNEDNLSLLTGLSQQAGASIQNARLFAEVQRQKQYMEAVVENSPVAIVTVDGDFHVVSWNPAAEKLFGYSEEEAIGQDAHDLHSKDESILAESRSYSQQIADGERVQAITQRTRKDGELVDVEVMGVPVMVEGNQVGNIIIYHDISELKRTEAALLEQKQYLEDVVGNSPVAIVTTDQQARVVSWNPAAETLFGYAADEAVGQDIDLLITGRDQDMQNQARDFSQLALEGRLHETTQRTRKDGSLVDVELLGVPVTVDGEQAGIIAIYHDITELKRATEEAQSANEAKSAFLATMSHEIRTPMNAVIGMSGLLLDTELTGEQREFAEIIRNSSDSLLAIINDILDFSKIEAGKMELEDQPFGLRECVEGTLDLVAGRAFEKDLDLAYFIEDGTPTRIVGDITRFRQILLNLLTNAVKFTDEGEVVVTVSADGLGEPGGNGSSPRSSRHAIRVRVRDTGIGIPPDRMNRLFQSFSQVDASTARKYGGTGLGLAISKRLAEMMGGTMSAESEVGKGTVFEFTIRAAEAEGATPTSLSSDMADPQLQGRRVLVVDDNATNRRILGLQVKGWGMIARDTHSPHQALEWIQKGEPFDVAVLDMHMPEMDGLSLAREIRKLRDPAKLPMVLFTSLGRREVDDGDIKFAAYLTKPIKPSQLLDALTAVFADRPAAAQVPSLEAPRIDPQLANRHPLRILLAEDNAVNQKLAIRLLQQMGYRADVAANGLEALESLGRQTYDVVLMDVQMPEMDGLEASREINRRWEQSDRPRIVAMTANAMQGDRERCIEAGMDDYISKPVRVHELVEALGRVPARAE